MKLLVIGATSAIAQEVAKNFAADGAEIGLMGRDAARLGSISEDLITRGARRVETFAVADLGETQAHEKLIEDAASILGGIDAALIAHGSLGDQKASESEVGVALREFNLNAVSFISLMTILGNYMEKRRGGCIAVISSVAGERGRGSNYVYGSAKAAVTAFSSGLRNRLSKAGVSVVTIKPGIVDTPMTAGLRKGPLTARADKVGKRIYEAMLKGEDVVYVPWFWAPILQVIRATPERVFKKLKM